MARIPVTLLEGLVRFTGPLGGAALGAGAAWIGYSRLFIDHEVPLEEAIIARRRRLKTDDAGEISYYEDRGRPGRPIVLVHGVHAAASAYEVRPLFERLRGERPVLAIDLPGFGFSERSDRPYTPNLFRKALTRLLAAFPHPGGADVVALSLGCEVAATVAVRNPELVRSLVLVSPTGFDDGVAAGGGAGARPGRVAVQALRVPVWSQAAYDLLVTRRSLRWFYGRFFVGPVDEDLLDYAWRTAHQPGARYAPFAFLSGRLSTPDVARTVYDEVEAPTLVLYDCDPYAGFDGLSDFVGAHPGWRAARIPGTCGLPQFEQPDETAALVRGFWDRLGAGEAPHPADGAGHDA